MSALHRNCVEVLSGWQPTDADQESHRQAYLEFLAEYPMAVQRENRIGHLTASALVMDEAREHVLLTLHPKVGRWLQLGGHMEAKDATLRDAAIREVHEECGLTVGECTVVPVQLDRHPVPCGPGPMSEHLDVQFLYTVPDVSPPIMSDESDDLRWFSLNALPSLDHSVRSLIARARS